MAVFIDVHSHNAKKLKSEIDSLQPCRGVCLFIDITNSTQIKYKKGMKDWILLLKNTFGLLEIQKKIKDNIIKFIGDEIMIFLTDDILFAENDSIRNYYTLLEEIYATVDMLKLLHVDEAFLKCKVSIHYCKNVYNFTFLKTYNDYYGKDIDISAHLISKAKENSIVISDQFYQRVLHDLNKLGKSKIKGCLKNINGTYIEDFKGIPHATKFWRLN